MIFFAFAFTVIEKKQTTGSRSQLKHKLKRKSLENPYMELSCIHYHSFEVLVNMAEVAEDGMPSSENEVKMSISSFFKQ